MSAADEIELVARALFEAGEGEIHSGVPWDTRISEVQQRYRSFAKAAMLATLDAIREPTEAMIEAGADWRLSRGIFRGQWQLAIDAKKAEIEGAEADDVRNQSSQRKNTE